MYVSTEALRSSGRNLLIYKHKSTHLCFIVSGSCFLVALAGSVLRKKIFTCFCRKVCAVVSWRIPRWSTCLPSRLGHSAFSLARAPGETTRMPSRLKHRSNSVMRPRKNKGCGPNPACYVASHKKVFFFFFPDSSRLKQMIRKCDSVRTVLAANSITMSPKSSFPDLKAPERRGECFQIDLTCLGTHCDYRSVGQPAATAKGGN